MNHKRKTDGFDFIKINFCSSKDHSKKMNKQATEWVQRFEPLWDPKREFEANLSGSQGGGKIPATMWVVLRRAFTGHSDIARWVWISIWKLCIRTWWIFLDKLSVSVMLYSPVRSRVTSVQSLNSFVLALCEASHKHILSLPHLLFLPLSCFLFLCTSFLLFSTSYNFSPFIDSSIILCKAFLCW